jgi:hypothetical protein
MNDLRRRFSMVVDSSEITPGLIHVFIATSMNVCLKARPPRRAFANKFRFAHICLKAGDPAVRDR